MQTPGGSVDCSAPNRAQRVSVERTRLDYSHTVMCRSMAGPRFEKCFLAPFGRCANIAERAYTRLEGGAYCSEAASLSRMPPHRRQEVKASTSESCDQEMW